MQRLYFLVPDVESATRFIEELKLANIDEHHIHLLAKDHVPLEKAHLPEATLLQKSEFMPAVEKGAAAGGVTGLLAGIAAVTFPPAGLVVGGGAILGMGLLGAGLGAWISGTLGSLASASQLRDLERAVEQGQLLMLVDVPKDRAEAIGDLVRRHQEEWLRRLPGGEEPA